jgi:putative transposase
MARPLRIEFPDALYHIISRGNEKRDIFLDSRDREAFHELLLVIERFEGFIIQV